MTDRTFGCNFLFLFVGTSWLSKKLGNRGSGGGVRGAGAGGGPGTDGWVQMLRARSPPGGYDRLDGPRMGRLEGFRAPRGASSVKGEGEERFQIRVVMKR